MKKFKTIGVLGGIGPVATAHFYQALLSIAQKQYGAVQDSDYPHIIINSLAFEGSTEYGLETDEGALDQLISGIKDLEKAGAEVIVIPCNSVHKHIDTLRSATSVPILSIIEETVAQVKRDRVQNVAVLASKSLHFDNIYYKTLENKGVKYTLHDDETVEATSGVILDVMSGKTCGVNCDNLHVKIKDLQKNNVQAVILGCTELPVAIKQEDTPVKLYDSISILADSVLKYAHLN